MEELRYHTPQMRRVRCAVPTPLVLLGVAVIAACENPVRRPPDPGHIHSGAWTLRFDTASGALLLGTHSADTSPLLELRGVRLVTGAERTAVFLPLRAANRDGDALQLTCAPHPDHEVRLTLRPEPDGALAVQVEDRVGLRNGLHELSIGYRLTGLGTPDETWLPHCPPNPESVAGDASFGLPFAFVRRGARAVGLVPDVAELLRERRVPQALEFEPAPDGRAGAPVLRHGLICHRNAGAEGSTGSTFTRTGADPVVVQAETLRFGHRLLAEPRADATTADRMVAGLWSKLAPLRPATPDIAGFDRSCGQFFPALVDRGWIDLGSSTRAAGTFRTGRPPKGSASNAQDAWYEARHNSLRTAYGLLLFANRTERPDLADRAEQVLLHALTAPDRGGLLPSVFVADRTSGQNTWSLAAPDAGVPDHYHTLDTAVSCYWMLRIVKLLPKHRERVLTLCRRTARFLMLNQAADGTVPRYFSDRFLAPHDGGHRASLEIGAVVRFLAEFGEAVHDRAALAAAQKAVGVIERVLQGGVLPDFETELAERSTDRVGGAPRQGTLGLVHAALGVLRLHEAHADPALDLLADRLLDRLGRFQQTWSPPWIQGACTGGFGLGTFACRWNDARQGLAALAFLEGYRRNGRSAWLERGIAALHAAFRTGGHEFQPPLDAPGPAATPHWGTGLACTVSEIARLRVGQGAIDLRQACAGGVDTVWFENLEARSGALNFRLMTHRADTGKVTVRCRGIGDRATWRVVANRVDLGELDAATLRRGFALQPVPVPRIEYRPPPEIKQDEPWAVYAQVAGTAPLPPVRVEIRSADTVLDTIGLRVQPGNAAPGARTLEARDPFLQHAGMPLGTVLRSRLLFEVDGKTYTVPEAGFREHRVSAYQAIDPGEGSERELIDAEGSRLRRFVSGREGGRHASGKASFSYRLPVSPEATALELSVRLAGRCRIRCGTTVVHEDAQPAPGERNIAIQLADRRLWHDGSLTFRFEPFRPADSIDVALIRYRAEGVAASLRNYGTTQARRQPAPRLHLVVHPVSLLDRPLSIDGEALRLAFFGGDDYRMTPDPEPRRTAGSVATLIGTLSGGRTTVSGSVLPAASWKLTRKELDRRDASLEAAVVPTWSAQQRREVDLVVVVLGKGSLPPPSSLRIAGRLVPVVFLAAQDPRGSFLSCGSATTAVLQACFSSQSLATPEWGNFGELALCSAPNGHLPAAPCGLNLARIGWSDPLILQRRDQPGMVISPLLPGRVSYVLDCSTLPGRGSLNLELRATGPAEPGLTASGALLYWSFHTERPLIRALEGASCSPRLLRLSSVRGRTQTPFRPGRAEDLFRRAERQLPIATLTGEQLWDVRNFAPLAHGEASLDVRYLGVDLLRTAGARWTTGEPAVLIDEPDAVQRSGTRVRLTLRGKQRLRLVAPGAADPSRLFCRLLRVDGRARVRVLTDGMPLVEAEVGTGQHPRWLQADAVRHRALWLEVENATAEPLSLDLGTLLRVPRVAPAHVVRPADADFGSSVRLSDDVTYGRSLRLPSDGARPRSFKTPVVLPKGPVALRVRGGVEHGSAAEVTLSIELTNRDGSSRHTVLPAHPIRGADPDSGLFLGLLELPAAAAERVAFLTVSWSGKGTLHLVDLVVVRP